MGLLECLVLYLPTLTSKDFKVFLEELKIQKRYKKYSSLYIEYLKSLSKVKKIYHFSQHFTFFLEFSGFCRFTWICGSATARSIRNPASGFYTVKLTRVWLSLEQITHPLQVITVTHSWVNQGKSVCVFLKDTKQLSGIGFNSQLRVIQTNCLATVCAATKLIGER